ncbi:MAG: uroporphyrinogen decarboxylase family protein [Candidatus Helarchaeota archaeon]
MGLIRYAFNNMKKKSKLTNFSLKVAKGTFKIRQSFRRNEKKNFEENKSIYYQKLERVLTAFKLKTPDRIPINGIAGDSFPALYSGYTGEDYLFNIDNKGIESHYNFIKDFFDFDLLFPTQLFGCGIGKLIDGIGVKFLKLPGKDLDPMSFYQFDEREIIKDPNDFKIFGSKYFLDNVLPEIVEIALPKKMRSEGTKSLFQIGIMAIKYFYRFMHHLEKTESMGAPMIIGVSGMQPFDAASLLFRGLRKISGDIRRRPEDIRRICDMIAPSLLNSFTMMAEITKRNRTIPEEYDVDNSFFNKKGKRSLNTRLGVFFVCERAFMMNPEKFEEISLPSLNYVIKGLCDAGLIPILQFEQDVTHLLPVIKKLPGPGKCVFSCDASDIVKAKEILGDHMCIMGNVPLSLLSVGTPYEIEKYVRNLIETVGKEPGYILGPALGIPGEAKPENVKALIQTGLKYGKLS